MTGACKSDCSVYGCSQRCLLSCHAGVGSIQEAHEKGLDLDKSVSQSHKFKFSFAKRMPKGPSRTVSSTEPDSVVFTSEVTLHSD